MTRDWRKLEYFVPIKEVLKESDNCTIKGTAINACTTRNGVRYTAEELKPAAKSLRNRPILKDHNNSVDSIVGKTTENVSFSDTTNAVMFEGIISDPKMKEMINDGLITSVSVGAMVKDLKYEEAEDGKDSWYTARGIEFVEISLVAVPADPNAGFEKAIAESYKLKTEAEGMMQCEKCDKEFATQKGLDKHTKDVHDKAETESLNIKLEEQKMSEEIKVQLEEKNRILEEQKVILEKALTEFKEKEMTNLRESYKSLATEKGVSVKEGYEKLSKEVMEAMIDTLKSVKKVEVGAAEAKPATKGEIVSTNVSEEVDKSVYVIEKSDLGKGFSMTTENIQDMHPRLKWR